MSSPTENALDSVANDTLSSWEFFKFIAKHAKEYFLESDERTHALLLLTGLISCLFMSVVINSILFAWSVGAFWSALGEMSFPLFVKSLEMLTLTYASWTLITGLNKVFMTALQINWRFWLTKKLIEEFSLSELEQSGLEAFAQRIQSDLKSFVDYTVALSSSFLSSTMSLPITLRSLWVIGGAMTLVISGASIVIPGYMVWVALGFGAVSSILAYKISKTLTTLTNQQATLEADAREKVAFVTDNGVSIALNKQENSVKVLLINQFEDIIRNAYQILRSQTKIESFSTFYILISSNFPYIAAAPLYFAKQITMGQLMEIGNLFSTAQSSLSWYTTSSAAIAEYKTTVNRIYKLEKTIDNKCFDNLSKIVISANAKEDDKNLYIKNLGLMKYPSNPGSTPEYIRRGMTGVFKAGEHVVIKGESGVGKSTFKKALAQVHTLGEGEIFIPKGQTIRCLPQQPVIMPWNTLRAFLAGKHPVTTYQDEDYHRVLRATNMSERINDLDMKTCELRLSDGQRQRLAFAQLLLEDPKPDWLFLDEATAAMDEDNETRMHRLLEKYFPNTTRISIAHRSTVEQFHIKTMPLMDLCKDKKDTIVDNSNGFFYEKAVVAGRVSGGLQKRPMMDSVLMGVSQ